MSKLRDFRIVLERAGATYSPGDTVNGKVILILAGPKNVREVRLKAKGEAEVHWTETRTVRDSDGRSRTVTDHYRNSESYFNVCIVLAGPSRGESSVEIPPGTHTYPFSFHIPSNVPCSFEHHIGHVRYSIKAVMDRPWRFDHKVMSAFTVIADYNLNDIPNLSRGINDEINREFNTCLCFGNAGTLDAIVKSRVRGFVPGEIIQLDVSYDNSSTSVDVEEMTLHLYKHLSFHATSKSKHKKEDIREMRVGGPFPKKGEQSLTVRVPSVPPSNLQNCRIIDISYQLVFKIHTSGFHRKIKRYYPVEIGTIPLIQRGPIQTQPSLVPSAPSSDQVAVDTQLLPPYQDQAGALPIGFADASAPPYPAEMPPPSYEECIGGGKLIGDPNEKGIVGSNMQFTPKYPVYNLPMPMPQPPRNP
ncbi:arrestin domain-containing protein 17 [Nasonia vitripennis]|uniref:Arrestin C-terminal-like domain-containing protein n=1 Tax=Nasonia vitripennis TaxID=7425 RepID=A0A7M7H8Y3_NASVI|nr:arrestin domain-containing protein 17 [Nasonia vitripennis]